MRHADRRRRQRRRGADANNADAEAVDAANADAEDANAANADADAAAATDDTGPPMMPTPKPPPTPPRQWRSLGGWQGPWPSLIIHAHTI